MNKPIKRILARTVGALAVGLLGLVVLFLVSSSFLISPDLPRADVANKYRSDNSFIYQLPSGAMAHIRDEGNRDGPILFLIHGSNASLHTWEPWVAQLSDRYRLISFDLPGHGLTGATPEDDYSLAAMSRFTREIADLFKAERIALAGNSMGGAVALQMALEYPTLVDALVLVSPSGMKRDVEDSSVGAFRLTGSAIGREIMRFVTPKFSVTGTLRGVVADPDNFVTDEMVTRYWEMLRMTGSRDATIKRFQSYATQPALQPRLKTLNMPTLILWGQQDKLIDVKYGMRMNAAIIGSFLRLYPQAGHLAHEEIPRITAGDTDVFLNDMVGF